MYNKLYNWAYILMNILEAKNYKTKIPWISMSAVTSKNEEQHMATWDFLAITDVRIQTRRAEMGGVAGFFDKELKNSRVGILKESENIHVWFQNCYSFNNLVSIYI